jgi:hypothetical protein
MTIMTLYITYKYHKMESYQSFYDTDFNIGGEVTHSQYPIKSIIFQFYKYQPKNFDDWLSHITNVCYAKEKVEQNHIHMFNFRRRMMVASTINSYAKYYYPKNLQTNHYFAGSIYSGKDLKYIINIAKDLNRYLVRIGLDYLYFIEVINRPRLIFIIDNLEINYLHTILDIFRYVENGLLFVMVNDEADLDKYNIRKYINLQLL